MPLQRGEILGYDSIEERASRKFFEGPRKTEGPVVLRSNDFFK